MTTGMKTRGTPAESILTRLADDPGLLQAGASGRIRGHPSASRPLLLSKPYFSDSCPSY